MESVDARHTEALKIEWAHITTEITARQNTMVNRASRIEGHINNLEHDQNNALESNQELWTGMPDLRDRFVEMSGRSRDTDAGVSSQELRDQQRDRI